MRWHGGRGSLEMRQAAFSPSEREGGRSASHGREPWASLAPASVSLADSTVTSTVPIGRRAGEGEGGGRWLGTGRCGPSAGGRGGRRWGERGAGWVGGDQFTTQRAWVNCWLGGGSASPPPLVPHTKSSLPSGDR